MKAFYHEGDLDGQCSGAIVKHRFPDCELIGINYGDEFPWDRIEPGETVYMVDFALKPWTDMQRLAEISDLTWIDHHKGPINDYNEYGLEALVGTAIGVAACELVWEWVYPDQPTPLAVRLLGRYDVWDHSDPDTLPFQYGMRLANPKITDVAFWKDILDDYASQAYLPILKNGHIVLLYVTQDNEKYAKACAFETELDGLHCIAVNRMLTNSQVFDSVCDPQQYDVMLTFGWRNQQWTVSLYSDKDEVDCSEIARRYGGDGHKAASGFRCLVLPFELR